MGIVPKFKLKLNEIFQVSKNSMEYKMYENILRFWSHLNNSQKVL